MESGQLGDAGNARAAAEQLVTVLQKGIEERFARRLDLVEERLEAVLARLDGVLAGGDLAAAAPGGRQESDRTAETMKAIATSVLLESGLVESLVTRTVEREFDARGGGAEPGEALRRQASLLIKEFLSRNLGRILENELPPVVGREVQRAVSSESVKELLDEKFRAVTLYLKSDVIPRAVREAIAEEA